MAIASKAQHTAYVLQPTEGEHLPNIGVRLTATGDATSGRLAAGDVTNPEPGGPPMHTHFEHDELCYVVAGCYRFKVGEAEHEGGPGTFMYAPKGTSHTFASVGPAQGRLFFITLPGLEGFLRRMSALQPGDTWQSEVEALFSDYQSRIDGPGLV